MSQNFEISSIPSLASRRTKHIADIFKHEILVKQWWKIEPVRYEEFCNVLNDKMFMVFSFRHILNNYTDDLGI